MPDFSAARVDDGPLLHDQVTVDVDLHAPVVDVATDYERRLREIIDAGEEKPFDETDISLRAYLSRISDERLREYDPNWSDEQVVQWDGNFRCDGALMLVCCERDIEIDDHGK